MLVSSRVGTCSFADLQFTAGPASASGHHEDNRETHSKLQEHGSGETTWLAQRIRRSIDICATGWPDLFRAHFQGPGWPLNLPQLLSHESRATKTAVALTVTLYALAGQYRIFSAPNAVFPQLKILKQHPLSPKARLVAAPGTPSWTGRQ